MTLIGGIFAVLGAVVLTLCVAGILRVGEMNVKIHFTAMLGTVGVPLVLAYPLLTGELETQLRVLLVITFQALTSPLGTHAMARAEAALRRRQ